MTAQPMSAELDQPAQATKGCCGAIAKVLADPRVTVEPGQANAVVLEALKGLGA